MRQLTLDGQEPITVQLRRHARSRRLSLRVSRLDGTVTMSLPTWTSNREAMNFVRERETWIRAQYAAKLDRVAVRMGGNVPLEAQETAVLGGSGRKVEYLGGNILVPDDGRPVGPRVAKFIKNLARQKLELACGDFADKVGENIGRISLRDTRTRWGSCSSAGNLMFSWRLAMAPVDVLNYVAAHEVAHLVEMNHSPKFWQVVAGIYPEYREQRLWLRENGQHLHRYDFGN